MMTFPKVVVGIFSRRTLSASLSHSLSLVVTRSLLAVLPSWLLAKKMSVIQRRFAVHTGLGNAFIGALSPDERRGPIFGRQLR